MVNRTHTRKIILVGTQHIPSFFENNFEVVYAHVPDDIVHLLPCDCIALLSPITQSTITLLKKNYATATIPLILFLPKYDGDIIKKAIAAGIDDYIITPDSSPRGKKSPLGEDICLRVEVNIARSQHNLDINPLTRLPGNRTIKATLDQRSPECAVLYIDINNFKNYNETYGFLKGDELIMRTAQVLADTLRCYGGVRDFLGHIGGDDFIIITTQSRANRIYNMIKQRCAQEIAMVSFSVFFLSISKDISIHSLKAIEQDIQEA